MGPIWKNLVVVALGAPLLVYVIAAFRTPRSKVSTLGAYFTARKEVGAAPVANASLAYTFQVTTLFPFLFWGIQGWVLPAIVNAVCLGIGIALFRSKLPRILELVNTYGQTKTLHGLLGTTFESKGVTKIAAGVTILGMLGVAVAEAYWGMQILTILVPADTPEYYALVFGALFFVLAYLWYGGAWGSMQTDMWQLVFAYIGFSFTLVFCIVSCLSSSGTTTPEMFIVGILMAIGAVLSVLTRLKCGINPLSTMRPGSANTTSGSVEDEQSKTERFIRSLLSLGTFVALIVLAVAFGVLAFRSWSKGSFAPLINPGSEGWIAIVALAWMPLAFQFVDMSQWQRLQALAGTSEEIQSRARRSTSLFAIESPFSWLMCLALGTLVLVTVPEVATAPDKAGALSAFPRLLIESNNFWSIAAAFTFMVAVMAIMLSTIDSAILAAMYTFVGDIREAQFSENSAANSATTDGPTNQDNPETAAQARDLGAGKAWAFVMVAGISAAVVGLGAVLGKPEQLIGILVGFFGAMLALLPAVIAMLAKKPKLNGDAVAAGIVMGVMAALALGVWSLIVPDQRFLGTPVQWYGAFAGPVVSGTVALLLSPLLAGVRPKD